MQATLIIKATGLTKCDHVPDLHVPVNLTGKQQTIDEALHTEIEIGQQSYWVQDCFVDRKTKPLDNLPLEINVTRYGDRGYTIGCLNAPPNVNFTDPTAALKALWDEYQAEDPYNTMELGFAKWLVNRGWRHALTCRTVTIQVGELPEY